MANPYLKFNGKTVRVGSGGGRLISPFEPIPPYTMRFEFVGRSENFDPTLGTGNADYPYWAYGTWTHVTGSVYDWTYQDKSWGGKEFKNPKTGSYHDASAFTLGVPTSGGDPRGVGSNAMFDNIEYRILGANLADVASLVCLFKRATKYLRSVALFDTSRVLIAGCMFMYNRYAAPQYLTQIPNFDFSSVSSKGFDYLVRPTEKSTFGGLANFAYQMDKLQTVPDITPPKDVGIYINNAFSGCTKVESGALSLYNKFSSAGWTTNYSRCFYNCGSSTETGAAELAQIPSGWK